MKLNKIKDLYTENYKSLRKKFEDKWRINIIKHSYYPQPSMESMQPLPWFQ